MQSSQLTIKSLTTQKEQRTFWQDLNKKATESAKIYQKLTIYCAIKIKQNKRISRKTKYFKAAINMKEK